MTRVLIAEDMHLIRRALETGSSPLTPRETDVLRAAEGGLPVDQIAARLALPRPAPRQGWVTTFHVCPLVPELGSRTGQPDSLVDGVEYVLVRGTRAA